MTLPTWMTREFRTADNILDPGHYQYTQNQFVIRTGSEVVAIHTGTDATNFAEVVKNHGVTHLCVLHPEDDDVLRTATLPGPILCTAKVGEELQTPALKAQAKVAKSWRFGRFDFRFENTGRDWQGTPTSVLFVRERTSLATYVFTADLLWQKGLGFNKGKDVFTGTTQDLEREVAQAHGFLGLNEHAQRSAFGIVIGLRDRLQHVPGLVLPMHGVAIPTDLLPACVDAVGKVPGSPPL